MFSANEAVKMVKEESAKRLSFNDKRDEQLKDIEAKIKSACKDMQRLLIYSPIDKLTMYAVAEELELAGYRVSFSNKGELVIIW